MRILSLLLKFNISFIFCISCSYTFTNSRPTLFKNVRSIAVLPVINRSMTPGLESICTIELRKALSENAKMTLVSPQRADVLVKAVVKKVVFNVNSSKKNVEDPILNRVPYQSLNESVNFSMQVTVFKRLNEKVIFNRRISRGITTFSADTGSTFYEYNKEVAQNTLCKNLAADFVTKFTSTF